VTNTHDLIQSLLDYDAEDKRANTYPPEGLILEAARRLLNLSDALEYYTEACQVGRLPYVLDRHLELLIGEE